MAKEKNPQRIKAMQMYLDSGGTLQPKEIAENLEVKPEQVRKWKCVDKWENELANMPKKRGGQQGNQNAAGHGAPYRNQNAVKHGAYSKTYFDELSEDERKEIEDITLDVSGNMLRELQTLIAKKNDLQKKIAELQKQITGELYIDRVVEMRTPNKEDKGETDVYGTIEAEGESKPSLNVSMETTIKSSAFERALKLEVELNKVQGRIIKLLDSIKSYELECRRMDLEEKRYTLMKQKVSGVFDVNPETGEIDDTYTEDDIEGVTADGV